jgi:hypothetical protein
VIGRRLVIGEFIEVSLFMRSCWSHGPEIESRLLWAPALRFCAQSAASSRKIARITPILTVFGPFPAFTRR